jgi:hypothetical protein
LLVAARERREEAEEKAAAQAAVVQAAPIQGESSAGAASHTAAEGPAEAEAAERVALFERNVADFVTDKRAWVGLMREIAAAPRMPGGTPLPTTFNAYSFFPPGQVPLGVAAEEAARKAAEVAAAEDGESAQPTVPDAMTGLGDMFRLKCLEPMELSLRAAMLRCLA